MDSLALFINKNKNKIRKISEGNVTRNNDGLIVLPRDDEWRAEEDIYEDLKNDKDIES